MKSDSMTILIVTPEAEGARSFTAKMAHLKLVFLSFIGLTLLTALSIGSAWVFYKRAKIRAQEKNDAVARLLELSQSSFLDQTSGGMLGEKLKTVEGKLLKLQKLLEKKGIREELSIGGEFIPADRLSLSYAEFLDRDISNLTDILRSSPLGIPVGGRINSPYGWRKDPFNKQLAFHSGVDIDAPWGEEVTTPADGVVVHAGWYYALGRAVIVEHEKGYRTTYGHLSRISVKEGQEVKAGDVVGLTGSTGRSTGAHLHYEIEKGGEKLDPKKYMYLR